MDLGHVPGLACGLAPIPARCHQLLGPASWARGGRSCLWTSKGAFGMGVSVSLAGICAAGPQPWPGGNMGKIQHHLQTNPTSLGLRRTHGSLRKGLGCVLGL